MTKENWQQIYNTGEQLNRYPYDFVVSSFYRLQHFFPDKPRVLDLGCGAGNHAIFCAENGAEVLATDYSTAALDVVAERAREKGVDHCIKTAKIDFENFTLPDSNFDIIIDRLAVSHVSKRYALDIYDQAHSALHENGAVISNLFTTGHSHKEFGKYDTANDIWHNFTDGIFKPLLTAYFYTEQDVMELFHKYTISTLVCETESDALAPGSQKQIWNIVAHR